MKIAFGTGLFLGDSSQEYVYEISKISGLEQPVIRNGNGLYAGADGGYWSSQYYGHRTVVIDGFSIAKGCDSVQQLREHLISHLPIRYICPITIEDTNGDYWYLEGAITDIKCELNNTKAIEYQITIVCADPLIYPAENLLSFAPISNERTLELNGSSTNILLPGESVYAYPVFEVDGEFTSPIRFENTTSNEYLEVAVSNENSDKLVARLKDRAVVQNGLTVNEFVEINSSWWKLNPGNNRLQITSGSSSDSATVKIKYSIGYRGI